MLDLAYSLLTFNTFLTKLVWGKTSFLCSEIQRSHKLLVFFISNWHLFFFCNRADSPFSAFSLLNASPALKIKVKEISYINGDTKIVPEAKTKAIYMMNGVTERDLRKMALWLRDGLQCICEEMNDIQAAYLVMGQKMDGHLVITSLKRWQKGQREFKRISRSIRKMQC